MVEWGEGGLLLWEMPSPAIIQLTSLSLTSFKEKDISFVYIFFFKPRCPPLLSYNSPPFHKPQSRKKSPFLISFCHCSYNQAPASTRYSNRTRNFLCYSNPTRIFLENDRVASSSYHLRCCIIAAITSSLFVILPVE